MVWHGGDDLFRDTSRSGPRARVAPGHHSHNVIGRRRARVLYCRPIWIRSRVHYMTPFLYTIKKLILFLYLFDSRRTCFVQHLRIQSFTHTLLFVFVFLCSSSSSSRRRRRRRVRTHAVKPSTCTKNCSRAAATFLFFLHRIEYPF